MKSYTQKGKQVLFLIYKIEQTIGIFTGTYYLDMILGGIWELSITLGGTYFWGYLDTFTTWGYLKCRGYLTSQGVPWNTLGALFFIIASISIVNQ